MQDICSRWPRPNVTDIALNAICRVFDIDPADMARLYLRRATYPRQAYWLLLKEYGMTLREIKQALPYSYGMTTIHYSIQTAAHVAEVDDDYRGKLERARALVQADIS